MAQPTASSCMTFEADHGAASLRAALAVFDDWDSDLTALFQLSSDSDASQHSYRRQPKHTKAAEVSVPYKQRRDVRKQEIAALRAQVDELETVLVIEKALLAQQQTLPIDDSAEAVAIRSEWERLATNQHYERLAAQAENARLRELFESQVKNAAQILKLTKRVTQLENALPVLPIASFEHYTGPQVDVETQLARLDAMLPRAVELFASGAFAENHQRDCFHEVQFRENVVALRGVGVQFEAAWMVPFEIERVVDALWIQTVRPTFKHKTSAFMDVYQDANTLVSQFISTPSLKDAWGASQGQIAARRLPPDLGDGSFLILVTIQVRAYMDSTWTGCADVEGWLRVESVPSQGDDPITRVKWYRHTLLQPPEMETMTASELSKWISSVISGPTRSKFQQNLEWTVQALENMLVSPKPAA